MFGDDNDNNGDDDDDDRNNRHNKKGSDFDRLERKKRFAELVETMARAVETGEMYDFFERDAFGNRKISKKFIAEYGELVDYAIADEIENIRRIADEERQQISLLCLMMKAEALAALDHQMEKLESDLDEKIHDVFRRAAEKNGLEYKPGTDGYIYDDKTVFDPVVEREKLEDLDRRIKAARQRFEESRRRYWGDGWFDILEGIFSKKPPPPPTPPPTTPRP